MAKDFVIYKVHIHKTKQAELYELLESMPKSIRGLYIREALEHYRLTKGLPTDKPEGRDISLARGLRRGLRREGVNMAPAGRGGKLRYRRFAGS